MSTETDGSLLCIEALRVSFASAAGEVCAVQDVSLTVGAGECLGVVGESGAGKSQIFLAALGLLAPNGAVRGSVRFGSTQLLGLPDRQLDGIRGARVGMIFQDPMTSLTPHVRIGDQIAEPLVRHARLGWPEARTQALTLLNQVHVTDAARRMRQYPHELSGGMRQRVMIAIALACKPALLIADEPTTALDVTMQAQILALLAELKRTQGMSMVLITHDMGAVAGLADRVAVMKTGRIVETGTVRAILNNPTHPYTRALLDAVPRLDEPGPQQEAGSAAKGDSLVLDNISVQFTARSAWRSHGTLRAVDGVSLELRIGEALGVVGESGSGKSTLARAALRLLESQAGRVVWFGRPVNDLDPSALKPLRRDLQVIFQDPLASLDPRMTVARIVGEPLEVHHPQLDPRARQQAAAATLLRVGLGQELLHRYPHELSGGQCQRVGIARAMVLRPRALICDEPVSALDMTVQEQIVRLLMELKREAGLSILFISHNLAVVRQLCDRILVLYLGRMMELAPAAALYGRPHHPYTRELLESAPVPDPDLQPQRLTRALHGEAPSPLHPPSGCVYRTRCPHATERCSAERPAWEYGESPERALACHHWRELG